MESCTSPSAAESATDLEKASVAEKSRSAEDAFSSATPCAPPQITAAIVPTLTTSLVAHTLHTLAALCAEAPMRDWLGSAEGSVFWLPLLTVLGECGNPHRGPRLACPPSPVEDSENSKQPSYVAHFCSAKVHPSKEGRERKEVMAGKGRLRCSLTR